MPLHMEVVCEDARAFLQANLPQQIEVVQTEAAALGLPPAVPLSVPEASQYFIGEESVYRALSPPSIFLIPSRAQRQIGSSEYDNLLYQTLRFQIMCLIDGMDHEELVRACMRLAQAVDATLSDQDVTPTGITARSTKVKIPTIDLSNVLVSRGDNKVFRGRVFIECLIMHWDQLTPLPIQVPTSGAGVINIGQIGTNTTIAAAVVESLLTTTDPTTVLGFTAENLPGNYRLSIYYRCTAPTTLTIQAAWQDGTGDQVVTLVSGNQLAQSFATGIPLMNCNGGMPITVTATAGAANVVYVSATLEKLF